MSPTRREKGLSLDGLPTKSLDALLVRCVPKALGIRNTDFYGTWRGRRETRLQKIGRAISEQRRISSVRFPSAASHAEGSSGWNFAIFTASLTPPDRVEILGDGTRPLEVLP